MKTMKLGGSTFLFGIFCFGTSRLALHGAVESVIVEKSVRYRQTDDSELSIMQSVEGDPNDGGAYGFSAAVEGEVLGGIAAPVITLPSNSSFPTEQTFSFNRGEFGLDDGNSYFGVAADGWGASSQGEIDEYFPSGTYLIDLVEETVTLEMTGDVYPEPVSATLNGGAWANGTYLINPASELEISVTPNSAFGAHLEDRIAIVVEREGETMVERFFSEDRSTDALTLTLPAGSLQAGESFWIQLDENAAVDVDDVLDGALQAAVYSTSICIKVEVRTSLAVSLPEGAVSGWALAGSASLSTKLPGLVYTLTVNLNEGTEQIDLVAEGDRLVQVMSDSNEFDFTEYERLEVGIVNKNTLWFQPHRLVLSIRRRTYFWRISPLPWSSEMDYPLRNRLPG